MLARVRSAALVGLDGFPVDVEVDLSPGLPAFDVVGLPDPAVRESRERVRSALRNAGFSFPLRRITVNLAPAHLRKAGPAFDLPIALGVLGASGQLPAAALHRFACIGELGLDGRVLPVKGAICLAEAASDRRLILPAANAAEAAAVMRAQFEPVADVGEAVSIIRGTGVRRSRLLLPDPQQDSGGASQQREPLPDLAQVRGQAAARRALEIVAAGGHHAVLVGPPGSGKTFLARCLPGILPPLSEADRLTITKVYSVRGLLPSGGTVATRPFRSPHHTITAAALIGGGSPPLPGEVSLAHGGVLFLDELSEFRAGVLDLLRQPLEDGYVQLVRHRQSFRFPARFSLVGASNPCPCGYLGHPRRSCRCREADLVRYTRRLEGPLADRIDLWVGMAPVSDADLFDAAPSEPSASVSRRVRLARKRQEVRLRDREFRLNAAMREDDLPLHCALDAPAAALLRRAMQRLDLSARAVRSTLRVARTIADLDEAHPDGAPLAPHHVSEAIQYRRPSWR
ncbi:MAG TPA: YifB family Mg chelatase-like AAA ATPase [Limnochordia bacterium]